MLQKIEEKRAEIVADILDLEMEIASAKAKLELIDELLSDDRDFEEISAEDEDSTETL